MIRKTAKALFTGPMAECIKVDGSKVRWMGKAPTSQRTERFERGSGRKARDSAGSMNREHTFDS